MGFGHAFIPASVFRRSEQRCLRLPLSLEYSDSRTERGFAEQEVVDSGSFKNVENRDLSRS